MLPILNKTPHAGLLCRISKNTRWKLSFCQGKTISKHVNIYRISLKKHDFATQNGHSEAGDGESLIDTLLTERANDQRSEPIRLNRHNAVYFSFFRTSFADFFLSGFTSSMGGNPFNCLQSSNQSGTRFNITSPFV